MPNASGAIHAATERAPLLSPARLPSRAAPAILTPVVLVVNGYHPFAGDAGIYVAGIRHLLHPALYPLNAAFIAAFTHLSLFAWLMAAIIRLTHLPLVWILFAADLASIYLYLSACGVLAQRVLPAESARWCATLLAAACASLPVAGTSLVLMDPYVTARSFATPLSLFALAAAIDRAPTRAALLVATTCLLHPLTGLWTAIFLAVYLCIAARRTRFALTLCGLAVLSCGLVFAAAHWTPVSAAYTQAVSLAPRSFLFLDHWRWFEVAGLLLPLLLFALAARRPVSCSPAGRGPARALCLTCVLAGATAVVIAALFVPPHGPWPLVPLQVLRIFCLIYAAGVVLSGGVLNRLRSRTPRAAALLLFALFAGMLVAQRFTWAGSTQIEWPGAPPRNPYQQAFLWIRTHTPPDAVFAFNPQLVYLPGEDEQGFRALSERDHLADDKDAGIAAVLPRLADRWARQRNPEFSVDRMTDAERRGTLGPLGATWLLLPHEAATSLPCPYRNSVAQICRLTPEPANP